MKRIRPLVAGVCMIAVAGFASGGGASAVTASGNLSAPSVPAHPSAKAKHQLHGLSVVTPTDVWAVGSQQIPGRISSYTKRWNGETWARVPSPRTPASLSAVSGVSEDDVWAVGFRYGHDYVGAFPYLLHFDGSSWRVAHQPDAKASGELTSVAAVSADDAYAVGYRALQGGAAKPLMEHWDGNAWTRVAVPSRTHGAPNVVLTSMTATSDGDIWALGKATKGTKTFFYVLHGDGTTWDAMDLPTHGYGTNYTGISGSSSSDVWVVGSVYDVQPITEHWNGDAWSDVTFPYPPGGCLNLGCALTAVTTLPDGETWAVGEYLASLHPDVQVPLIGYLDGSSWTLQTAEGQGPHRNVLTAVGGVSPDDVWAVGVTKSQSFTRHWDGSSWQ